MIFDTGREGRLSNMLTLKCVTLKRQLNVLKHQLIIRDSGEEGGGGGRGGGGFGASLENWLSIFTFYA